MSLVKHMKLWIKLFKSIEIQVNKVVHKIWYIEARKKQSNLNDLLIKQLTRICPTVVLCPVYKKFKKNIPRKKTNKISMVLTLFFS